MCFLGGCLTKHCTRTILDHIICLYRNTVLNAGGGDMIHVIYIYMILILVYTHTHY